MAWWLWLIVGILIAAGLVCAWIVVVAWMAVKAMDEG